MSWNFNKGYIISVHGFMWYDIFIVSYLMICRLGKCFDLFMAFKISALFHTVLSRFSLLVEPVSEFILLNVTVNRIALAVSFADYSWLVKRGTLRSSRLLVDFISCQLLEFMFKQFLFSVGSFGLSACNIRRQSKIRVLSNLNSCIFLPDFSG